MSEKLRQNKRVARQTLLPERFVRVVAVVAPFSTGSFERSQTDKGAHRWQLSRIDIRKRCDGIVIRRSAGDPTEQLRKHLHRVSRVSVEHLLQRVMSEFEKPSS